MPKKYDKEPIGWITRGGKHVPIFDKEGETLTKGNIKSGITIIETSHPENGDWLVRGKAYKDDDLWTIKGESGEKILMSDEFRFYHIKKKK